LGSQLFVSSDGGATFNEVSLPDYYWLLLNIEIESQNPQTMYIGSAFDLLGREVLRLVNERQEAGYQSVIWNGRDRLGREVATGIYIYRLTAGDFVMTRKLVLMK